MTESVLDYMTRLGRAAREASRVIGPCQYRAEEPRVAGRRQCAGCCPRRIDRCQ